MQQSEEEKEELKSVIKNALVFGSSIRAAIKDEGLDMPNDEDLLIMTTEVEQEMEGEEA